MAVQRKRKRVASKGKQASSKFNVADIGHKVWLAGLGALARTQSEGPKLFERLVEEGSVVHERTRDSAERAVRSALDEAREAIDTRMEGMRDKASETWDSIEKIFQSRVQKALEQLGVPTAQEIRSLSRKVDELTRSVQSLGRGGARARPNARPSAGRKHSGHSKSAAEQSAAV